MNDAAIRNGVRQDVSIPTLPVRVNGTPKFSTLEFRDTAREMALALALPAVCSVDANAYLAGNEEHERGGWE